MIKAEHIVIKGVLEVSKGPTVRLKRRSRIVLALILVCGFGAVIFRLAHLMLVEGDYLQQKAVYQQLTDTKISAKRGTIYDSTGKVLAKSATVWRVVLAPIYFENDDERLIVSKGLAKILDLKEEDVYEKSQKKLYYVELKRKVESDVRDRVLEFIDKIKEENKITDVINLLPDYKRYYPLGSTGATVIGFTGADDQGLEGIEYMYDSFLTGVPGRMVTAKNANGTNMPFDYEQMIAAQDGNDITLTIDSTVQQFLEKHLEKGIEDYMIYNRAVAIMIDVNTGAVLGMAVENGYDLNDPFEVSDEKVKKAIAELAEDKQQEALSNALTAQWRNKAIGDTYYPGSVFKVCTAAMALEEGVVTTESTFTCTGSYVPYEGVKAIGCHNLGGHGTQNFVQALCNSCNPAFMMIGQRVGEEKFYEYYKAFGFSEKTGIDLPGESEDIFFDEDGIEGNMWPVDLAVASFGQNFAITPLQMVMAVSSIANGGKLLKPYLVAKITDSEGNVIRQTEPVVKRQVISESTSKTMCEILETNAIKGSGKNGYVAGYRIAGKTGTSEKKIDLNGDGEDDYIASYCGFAPADNPQVALIVYFDTPTGMYYYGSQVAAPVFASMMKDILPYLGVETQYTDEELQKLDVTAKSYIGKALSAAENEIEQDGLKHLSYGNGDTVISQIPESGTKIPDGGTVVLYTDENSKDAKVVVPDLTNLTMAEANRKAAQYNLNISISGATSSGELLSVSQDIAEGEQVSPGTVITVQFRTNSGDDNVM